MNELENEMLPFAHLIRTLTKELGYDPSKGCSTFQEVLDKLPENEKIKIEYDPPVVGKENSVKIKASDREKTLKDEESEKEIEFSLEPNSKVVVNDKITQKKHTYIPPMPKLTPVNIEEIKLNRHLAKEEKLKNKNKNNI